jgi:hypothetical protein
MAILSRLDKWVVGKVAVREREVWVGGYQRLKKDKDEYH